MSDVLSQNEIDDLLAALSTGEVNVKEIEEESQEKKVRKYDFTRPDKFAKDQLRTLEIIHENFARLLNNFLSGYLRTFIDVQVISVQSLIYSEFSNSISNPAILGIIDFSPLDGQIVIDLSPELAFTMIERVLGGAGTVATKKENRGLTEIELTLIRTLFNKFINLLKEPWGNIIELKPKLETIESNSQFAQVVSPTESIALVTFTTKIADTEGLINLAIPHFVIEPILPNLSSRLWFTTTGKKETLPEEKTALQRMIAQSDLSVQAIVGGTKITVLEFLSLNVGDVVLLDKTVDSDFEIFVEGELKYLARPGLSNKKLAVKITQSLDEGVEENG